MTVEHFIIYEFPRESSTQKIPNVSKSPDLIQEYPIKDIKKVSKQVISGRSATRETPKVNHQPPDRIQKSSINHGIWKKLGSILQNLTSHC